MKTITTLFIMQIIAKFIWYSIGIIAGGFILAVLILAIYKEVKERVERELLERGIKERLNNEGK